MSAVGCDIYPCLIKQDALRVFDVFQESFFRSILLSPLSGSKIDDESLHYISNTHSIQTVKKSLQSLILLLFSLNILQLSLTGIKIQYSLYYYLREISLLGSVSIAY